MEEVSNLVPQALSLSRIVRSKPGWYRGDFHAHTRHSDGHFSPSQLADLARSEGLDFLAITDHNTTNACSLFGPQPDLLIIPGVEATFDEGYFNIFGVQDLPSVNESSWMSVVCTGGNRVKLAGGFTSLTELLQATVAEGLLNSINHPLLSPWEWVAAEANLRFVSCLEIWNDPSWPGNREANPQAVALWTDLLNAGHRLTATGGSDCHRPVPEKGQNKPAERLGYPSTFVYAAELSGNGILEGLRHRRAYVSLGPRVFFQANFQGKTYDIGGEIRPDPSQRNGLIELTAGVLENDASRSVSEPSTVRIVRNGRTVVEMPVTAQKRGQIETNVRSNPAEPAWYCFEVVDEEDELLAITNPIFVGSRPVPDRYLCGDFIGAARNRVFPKNSVSET
jgi:hypothetical protein